MKAGQGHFANEDDLLEGVEEAVGQQNLVKDVLGVAADATDDNGSCAYAATGFDCDGNCLFDDDQDGVCDQDEVTGCQDATACNYEGTATNAGYCVYADAGYDCSGNCLADADGDGVCDVFESAGCADTCACNYDVDATDDDGSCAYPAAYYDCAGVCLNDGDGDGVCDENEIAGCTGPGALNFNPLATDEDGSCLYCEDADSDGACDNDCLLYTSPSPRDGLLSRMPSSA